MTITRVRQSDYPEWEITGSRHPCPGKRPLPGLWNFPGDHAGRSGLATAHRTPADRRRGGLYGRPEPGPDFSLDSTVSRRVNAHIGPPAVVSNALRRPQAAKASPWCPRGGGAKRRRGSEPAETGADNPSVTLREPAPFTQGSLPSQAQGREAFDDGASEAAVCTGGYKMYSVIT